MFAPFFFQGTGEAPPTPRDIIGKSLRFRGAEELERTFATAGDQNKWTYSCWIKRGDLGSAMTVGLSTQAASYGQEANLEFNSAANLLAYGSSNGTSWTTFLQSTQVFRDPSAWYHLMAVLDTDQASSDDRWKWYVNGTQITSFSTNTQPGQGTNNYTNSAQSHTIGSRSNGILKFDGYMADVYFIDGQALEPTAFGRYNTAGVWVPRKVDFTPAELRNSDFLTCSGSGFAAASPATNAFDGLTTTFAEGQDANSVITWTPPGGVAYTSSVQVWSQRLNTTASINGGPAVALNDNAITEIATGSGTINTLTITGTLNGAASLGIIEIDGDPVLNPFIWSDGLWANPTTTFTTDTSQLNKTFLSGYPATNAFDGNDSTTCIAEGAGGNWITWIGNLTNVTTLEVRSDSLQQIYVNGELASITPAAGPSAQTYTITSPPETINNISCQAQSAANARIYAITVNGQVLVDGTNPSYGVNGFHLQFADTSNIGLDTSGNGNDFTATGFDFSPVGVWSDDLFTNNFDEAVPNFNSTEKSFYVSTPADQGFNGNNANYAGTGNPGSWLFWRPTPQTVQSTIALQCNFELESIYINEVLVDWNDVQDGGGGVKINPIIPFTGTLSNLAWRGKASTFAATVAILQIDGVTYIDNLGANYDSMQDSPTQNYATINLLYPGASTSKANLTTANATGKPTILGIAGNVGVDGAAVAWDGTEAGWTSTGAINFGQQPSGFDEFSTSTMPAATIPAGRAYFQAIEGTGDGPAAAQLGVSDWAKLVTTTGDVKNVGVASGDTYNWNSVAFDGYFANSSQGYCVLNSADASFTVTLPSSQTSRVRVSGRGGTGAVGTVTLDSGETTTWTGQSGTSTAVWTNYTNESTFTTITITGNNTGTPWFVAIEIEEVGVLTTAGILAQAQAAFPKGLYWIKDLENANQWQFVSFMTGNDQALQCPASGPLTSYVPPTGNSIAYCWNSVNDAVINTDGTTPSQVSADPKSGFSIVAYNGTGANATVGHGLGTAPEFMIIKQRDATRNFSVYDQDAGNNNILFLNLANAVSPAAEYWQNTDPTADVFSIGTSTFVNAVGAYVAYCWTSIPGFSATGSYTGNGNADGPFIYTGFETAFVMIKRINNADHWTVRSVGMEPANNPMSYELNPDMTNPAQTTSTNTDVDFLSNGFKLRSNDSRINGSESYLYLAFASNPFGADNTSPVTAY